MSVSAKESFLSEGINLIYYDILPFSFGNEVDFFAEGFGSYSDYSESITDKVTSFSTCSSVSFYALSFTVLDDFFFYFFGYFSSNGYCFGSALDGFYFTY